MILAAKYLEIGALAVRMSLDLGWWRETAGQVVILKGWAQWPYKHRSNADSENHMLMGMAVRATPKRREALKFSLMISVRNRGLGVSEILGSQLIAHHHFTFFNVWTALIYSHPEPIKRAPPGRMRSAESTGCKFRLCCF